jgi:hypothetical protein
MRATAPLYCEERKKLAERFATCARLYAEAVAMLASKSALYEIEGSQLWKAVLEAQHRSEEAGEALKEHVASHPCGTRRDGQISGAFFLEADVESNNHESE